LITRHCSTAGLAQQTQDQYLFCKTALERIPSLTIVSLLEEIRALPRWTQSPDEELANAISHAIGFVATLSAAPILLVSALHRGGGFFVGTIVFLVTMSILYLGSTLYHAWPQTPAKHVLRLFDHAAIFLLIAGTYTPFTLGPLRAVGGLTMLALVWALAIFGVVLKVVRGTSRHVKLAMSLYLGTGWIGVLGMRPFALVLPAGTLLWLVAGGIAYTVGVLFFVNKRLRYAHLIWHLFVLAGSACHFAAVLSCAT
jgi:hemolysin III